jgi:hypothetical protein
VIARKVRGELAGDALREVGLAGQGMVRLELEASDPEVGLIRQANQMSEDPEAG